MARADRHAHAHAHTPTPDSVTPSLEGADEREILLGFLAWAASIVNARPSYRQFREGYETANDWELPVRPAGRPSGGHGGDRFDSSNRLESNRIESNRIDYL